MSTEELNCEKPSNGCVVTMPKKKKILAENPTVKSNLIFIDFRHIIVSVNQMCKKKNKYMTTH